MDLFSFAPSLSAGCVARITAVLCLSEGRLVVVGQTVFVCLVVVWL